MGVIMSLQIVNRNETPLRFHDLKIYLGGVSGVGKSTVAKILSSKLNLPLHEVEARDCWSMSGQYRQRCFAIKFIRLMNFGHGVYTNHVISVYGYTVAMGVEELIEEVKIVSMVNRRGLVVLAVNDPRELKNRIEKRLRNDRERGDNRTENNIDLHIKAQQYIIELANTIKIPVLYTDNKTPDDVAEEIIKTIGFT